MCIFRGMSDAYDPRQEFPAGPIITGALVLVVAAFLVVGFITKWFSEGKTLAAPAAAAAAPAAVPEKPAAH
jgi:hypothetical protein